MNATAPRRPMRWRPMLGAAAVAAALGGVFLLYLKPDFVVTLANQMWACF